MLFKKSLQFSLAKHKNGTDGYMNFHNLFVKRILILAAAKIQFAMAIRLPFSLPILQM